MSQYKPFEYEIKRIKKETKNQTKKHYSHFSDTEFHVLSAFINGIADSKVKILNHARNHIPFLNQSIVNQTLDNCQIIEFNVTNNSPRILVRSKKQLNIIVDGNLELAHVCIVIDIKKLEVITSYLNCSFDNHSSLNLDRYDATLDILKYAM
jgi:hypothetical protein